MTAGTAGTAPRWGATLDSVVVYAQGALCRRLARGSVPPDGRVRVTGLPRSLDPGSLRARVLGAPGVRVTEARVEIEAEPLGSGTPDALRREVERLRDAQAAARGRRNRQLGLIEEVRALHPVPPARMPEDPYQYRRTPVEAWLELADFVEERLTGLHARLVELEEALRDVEHELAVAADRLARASTDAPSAHVETTVCAVLTLDGAGTGAAGAQARAEVEVELEYGVPGAVWVPTYRLTHRQGDDSGRLVLRASVAQRTGEDWTGVRIALATADLRRRTDLPKLRSIRIGRRQPAPAPSGWREPPAGLAGLFAGYESAGPRPATAPVPSSVGVGSGSDSDFAEVTSVRGGAFGPPLPPPPPPAAQGYGAPPLSAPQGYGGAMPDLAQPAPFQRGAGPIDALRSFAGAPAALAPAAPGRAAPPPSA
ncbi:DUF4139 domain-containing protein, partial [Streptomyces sp. ISL-66]|uniref:DUF4139 domain-containing protein n=1 Tax=Streptomyces sp. ISL-66 TaxID=2819186 RepID=UPI001BE9CD8E